MRIAAVPARLPWVVEALEPERKHACIFAHRHYIVDRLVVETPGHLGTHGAPRQPPFTGAFDVRVGRPPQAYVGADVHVPTTKVPVNVLMVAVWLERDTLER